MCNFVWNLPQLLRQNDFFGATDDDYFKIDFAWGFGSALHTLAFWVTGYFPGLCWVLRPSRCPLAFDRSGFDMWYPNENRGKVVGSLLSCLPYFIYCLLQARILTGNLISIYIHVIFRFFLKSLARLRNSEPIQALQRCMKLWKRPAISSRRFTVLSGGQ